MATRLEQQIRGWVGDYLAGRMLLSELEEAMLRATWTLPRGSDPGTDELVGGIELLFAERTSGHRTDEELRSLLRGFGPRTVWYRTYDDAPRYTTSVGHVEILEFNFSPVVG